MAETDHHRNLMLELIETLKLWFLDEPKVYVSGNLLLFYDKRNKRRHVSPDVFVVRGVLKAIRPNYLMWEEKTPDVVVELTSKTTREEDAVKKWKLYEGQLKVKEYYLFDPYEDYLDPSFQGFRRVRGKFRPIEFADGRLTSECLGLELERDGIELRFRDPSTGNRVLTPNERTLAEAERADLEAERADLEAERAENALEENTRLRRELAELKRRLGEQ